MKLLGFVFDTSPDASAQVRNLINRATSRFFVLRYYSNFMSGNDLRKLYCALIRSVLEYSSVTYGPMLTKAQSNDLENVQKKCLRCMYGYQKTYSELLLESGLSSLKDRRQKAILKFAQKASENQNYHHWFPLNTSNRSSQRLSGRNKYMEHFARSKRLYNSPLFYMRRLLNGNQDDDEQPHSLVVDFSHVFNDPYA